MGGPLNHLTVDVDCERNAAGVGEKGSVIKRRKRCERKSAWYSARSCSFGTFVFGPFKGVLHFFVVCLFEVVPMTVLAHLLP